MTKVEKSGSSSQGINPLTIEHEEEKAKNYSKNMKDKAKKAQAEDKQKNKCQKNKFCAFLPLFLSGLLGGFFVLAGLFLFYYLPVFSSIRQPLNKGTPLELLAVENLRKNVETLQKSWHNTLTEQQALKVQGEDSFTRVKEIEPQIKDLQQKFAHLTQIVTKLSNSASAPALAAQSLAQALPREILALQSQMQKIEAQIALIEENKKHIAQNSILSAENKKQLEQNQKNIAQLGALFSKYFAQRPLQTKEIALLLTANRLQNAIHSGVPFTEEFAFLAKYAPTCSALKILEPYKNSGLATPVQLLERFDILADKILREQKAAKSEKFSQKIWQDIQNLITIRPIGEVSGDGIAAILARMENALKRQDYAEFFAQEKQLPKQTQSSLILFNKKIEAYREGDKLLQEILSSLLEQQREALTSYKGSGNE